MSWLGTLQRLAVEITPWFLQGKNLGAFNEAIGLTLDAAVDALSGGLQLGQPLRCDASALPVLARDRKVTLYDSEPEESKRYRLAHWLQLARFRGTHYGEMLNLQPWFLPGALPMLRVFHTSGSGISTCHTLWPDGTYTVTRCFHAWNWDGQWSHWSRYWLVIYRTGTSLDAGQTNWDTGLWGGKLWGGLPTAAQVADIVAIVRESKAAHDALWGVILAKDPASFDPAADITTFADGSTSLPNGQWGLPIDPVTGKPTRLQTATFLYDRGAP